MTTSRETILATLHVQLVTLPAAGLRGDELPERVVDRDQRRVRSIWPGKVPPAWMRRWSRSMMRSPSKAMSSCRRC